MKIQKILIPILLILMLLFLIYGWLFGFPGERVKLSKEVKRYVEENYRLTPTDIQISFSIDGMDGASVTTKEWPFTFDVFIHRDKKRPGVIYI